MLNLAPEDWLAIQVTLKLCFYTTLILLLIVRNFTTVTPNMSATLSQLRDFVCGCIGFLVRRAREN